MNKKNSKNAKFCNSKLSLALLVVLLVCVLEIFLFNFRFFQTLYYEPLVLQDVKLDNSINAVGNSTFHFSNDNATMQFENINTEVKNIYINAENTKTLANEPDDYNIKDYKSSRLIKVGINIDDYSKSNGINMPERCIVSTVEMTKYIPLNLKGESHKLTLTFKNVKDQNITIHNITLNENIPFHFSIIRVIVLLAFISLLYIIRPKSGFYSYKLNFKSKQQRILIPVIIAVQIIIMITASHINPMYVHNTVSWQSQYIELTDAILDGHYYLNDNPDPKLQDITNPYDPDARDNGGASASWDHAYYEGKYYVYFGIVPALLFNIPVKAIADIDIKPFTCILTLIPVFIIMSWILIYAIAKKFMTKENESIPLLLYIMLSTIFVSGTGTAFLMVWPDMYTLPIFTALTLAVSGLYCWITSFKKTDEGYKLSNIKLFIGSLLLALIAGCRPQMLLVLFTAVPLFWNTVFMDRKLFSKNSISQSICFVLPIIIFAAFMFHYNYARFGSIFDFGANYNLTTNDMTSRGINLARIPQGIFYYILQPLNIEGIFPYITTTNFATRYMGITIKEGTYGGIFFLQPLTFVILLLPKVKEELKERGLWIITILLTVFAVIIASADAIMAGILARYFIDFSWLFVLTSIIIIFAAYTKYGKRGYWKIFNIYMPVCFVSSILITFLITVGTKYYSPADTNPEIFWKIATAIQFWL